jgi:hypothetical protein
MWKLQERTSNLLLYSSTVLENHRSHGIRSCGAVFIVHHNVNPTFVPVEIDIITVNTRSKPSSEHQTEHHLECQRQRPSLTPFS